MKLKVNQLRVFRAASSAVKNLGLLPINNFLKFENNTVTKTNSESYIVMPCEFDGSVLIDEKLLYAFIDNVKTDEIEVKIKDKTVTLTDGKIKQSSPTEDIKMFPTFPEESAERIEFDERVLWAINYSYNFTQEDESNPYKECVMIGNNIIGATNAFIAYTEIHGLKCNLVLHRDRAQTISKYESVLFCENDNYQFFDCGSTRYAFVKRDTKFIDLTPFTKLPGGDRVLLNKDVFINFCSMCIASTPAGAVLESEISGNCLVMQYPQHNIDISIPLDLPLETSMNDFSFNPSLMLKLLKSVPDQDITFVHAPNKYYVSGDSGFVGLIMEMKKN